MCVCTWSKNSNITRNINKIREIVYLKENSRNVQPWHGAYSVFIGCLFVKIRQKINLVGGEEGKAEPNKGLFLFFGLGACKRMQVLLHSVFLCSTLCSWHNKPYSRNTSNVIFQFNRMM